MVLGLVMIEYLFMLKLVGFIVNLFCLSIIWLFLILVVNEKLLMLFELNFKCVCKVSVFVFFNVLFWLIVL